MEFIRTSSELRNKYNEISKQCRDTCKPVFITVNGHGDTVIMNIEQYDDLITELELLKILSDSEDDVRNGRISLIDDTIKEIETRLK